MLKGKNYKNHHQAASCLFDHCTIIPKYNIPGTVANLLEHGRKRKCNPMLIKPIVWMTEKKDQGKETFKTELQGERRFLFF